jgi:hypothetical protein
MKVAIVGASSTDTTELSLSLAKHLQNHGIALEVIDNPAIQALRSEDLVLLCGLDLTSSDKKLLNLDQEIRTLLLTKGIGFQVVHGQGSQRLQNALFCLANQAPQWADSLRRLDIPARWTGPCETCGDGLCEHRLFTQLVSNKE